MSDVERWKPEVDVVSDEDVSIIGVDKATGVTHEATGTQRVGRLVIEEHEWNIPAGTTFPGPGAALGRKLVTGRRSGLEQAGSSVVLDPERARYAKELELGDNIVDAEVIGE